MKVTKQEKYNVLVDYYILELPVSKIARDRVRNRATIQKIIDEDPEWFDKSQVEDRLMKVMLEASEKSIYHNIDTINQIDKTYRRQAGKISNREIQSYGDMKMLIEIDKQVRPYYLKLLNLAEQIKNNKLDHNVEDDASKQFLEGFANLMGSIKDDK